MSMANIRKEQYQDLDNFSISLPIEIYTIIEHTAINDNATQEDKRKWGLITNGVYFTSSDYTHITRNQQVVEGLPRNTNFKHIQIAKIHNKLKMFLRIIQHQRTKTIIGLVLWVCLYPRPAVFMDIPKRTSHISFSNATSQEHSGMIPKQKHP